MALRDARSCEVNRKGSNKIFISYSYTQSKGTPQAPVSTIQYFITKLR